MMRPDPRNVLPGKIETERLVLRAPMRGDVPALAALADNRRIFEVLARLPHPYTRADAIAFVEIVAQRSDERVYAITLADGAFIGCIGLHFFAGQPPELGYWLGEHFWGQGYGTEAARALLAAAHETQQFPVIGAIALATNQPSIHVLEKVGFVKTAESLETQGHSQGKTKLHFMLEKGR
ncbi:MAG TPA: GNAT family N-acetyltransferase [Devosiaceae bacterium]|jgi:RimJ/RimL family protein N-acetyltransferase